MAPQYLRLRSPAAQLGQPSPARASCQRRLTARSARRRSAQMRKTIARRLQQSMQTAPHFYVTMAIETTQARRAARPVNEYAAALPQPVKVTFNDLIVKAVAMALARMPQVNVSFDGERLLFKKHINIGVAVALEQGLIVPVIRDADKRGILDLARESRRLIGRRPHGQAQARGLPGRHLLGEQPGHVRRRGVHRDHQSAGVGHPGGRRDLPTPVVREGQVVVRDIMKVTLSVDHRALDGATAARFLQELKRLLENPLGMLV